MHLVTCSTQYYYVAPNSTICATVRGVLALRGGIIRGVRPKAVSCLVPLIAKVMLYNTVLYVNVLSLCIIH